MLTDATALTDPTGLAETGWARRVPRVCLVSHRLGGRDGVSVEAAKWSAAFTHLGWPVTRAAGLFCDHQVGDVTVAGLWAQRPGEPPPAVDRDAVRALVATHDLVVLDNVGSLPSAPLAARAWQDAALAAHRAMIIRHHDPAWPAATDDREPPPLLPLHHPAHLHATINQAMYTQFALRWPELIHRHALRVVHNRVDVATLAAGGDRAGVRAELGVADEAVLLVHPARAVARKNIPAAVRFARRLAELSSRPVRYWLTAEDSPLSDDGPVGPLISAALAQAPGGALRGPIPCPADMYAAADVVVLPSTWEGWGLPVVEAAAAGRPVVAGPYPVLAEIRAHGLRVYDPDEIAAVSDFLLHPDRVARELSTNQAAVTRHFDAAGLPDQLRELASQARILAAAAPPAPCTPTT